MSMYCERCNNTSYGTTIECPHCGFSPFNFTKVPRKTMRARLISIDEGLHKFFEWLDYRATVLEFFAIYAGLIIVGLFAAASLITVLFVGIRAWVMFIMGVLGW